MLLTCICCKTLEHFIGEQHQLALILSLPADCQHGFCSQRLYETQLVHNIISNLDGAINRGHKQADLIIMDLTRSCTGGYCINLIIMGSEGPPISGSAPGSLGTVNK